MTLQIANVSLIKAVTYDPLEKKWGQMDADNFDPANPAHERLELYCPCCDDETLSWESRRYPSEKNPDGKGIRLKFMRETTIKNDVPVCDLYGRQVLDDHYKPQMEQKTLIIPPRFTRWPGAHEHGCDIPQRFNRFKKIFDAAQGQELESGVLAVNLHIPTDGKEEERENPRASDAYTAAPARDENRGAFTKAVSHNSSGPKPIGLSSAKALAELVHASRGVNLTEQLAFRNAGKILTASELFHDDPLKLLSTMLKHNRDIQPVAFCLTSCSPKKWKNSISIKSKKQRFDNEGAKLRVRTILDFGNHSKLWASARDMINRDGKKDRKPILVFGVVKFDRQAYEQRTAALKGLESPSDRDANTIHLVINVSNAKQFAPWDSDQSVRAVMHAAPVQAGLFGDLVA